MEVVAVDAKATQGSTVMHVQGKYILCCKWKKEVRSKPTSKIQTLNQTSNITEPKRDRICEFVNPATAFVGWYPNSP